MQGSVSYQFVDHALAQVRLKTGWMDVVPEDLIRLHITHTRWNIERALWLNLVHAFLHSKKFTVVPVLNFYQLLVEFLCF